MIQAANDDQLFKDYQTWSFQDWCEKYNQLPPTSQLSIDLVKHYVKQNDCKKANDKVNDVEKLDPHYDLDHVNKRVLKKYEDLKLCRSFLNEPDPDFEENFKPFWDHSCWELDFRILSSFKKLRVLSIRPGYSHMQAIKKLTRLRELAISFGGDVEYLTGTNFPHLQNLSLHKVHLSGSIFCSMTLPKLKTLEVENYNYFDSTIDLKCLSGSQQLKTIKIEASGILMSQAVNLPSLKSLTLECGRTMLPANSVTNLGSSTFPSLKTLDLEKCKAEGARPLLSLIKNKPVKKFILFNDVWNYGLYASAQDFKFTPQNCPVNTSESIFNKACTKAIGAVDQNDESNSPPNDESDPEGDEGDSTGEVNDPSVEDESDSTNNDGNSLIKRVNSLWGQNKPIIGYYCQEEGWIYSYEYHSLKTVIIPPEIDLNKIKANHIVDLIGRQIFKGSYNIKMKKGGSTKILDGYKKSGGCETDELKPPTNYEKIATLLKSYYKSSHMIKFFHIELYHYSYIVKILVAVDKHRNVFGFYIEKYADE